MRLQPPDSVRAIQRKLYRKAKQEPAYRFYLQRLRDKVKALTDPTRAPLPTSVVSAEVNRVVHGWAGHIYFKYCARDFRNLRRFVEERVRVYLRRKHRHRTGGYQAFPNAFLYDDLGLYRLPLSPPWLASAHASR